MASPAITFTRGTVTRMAIGFVLFVFLIASAAVAYLDAAPAEALGSSYFDDDGSTQANCDVYDRYGNTPACDSSEIRQVIGQTQYVQRTGTKVRAYFKENRGQVTIDNLHWCPGNAYGDTVETEDNDQGVAIGENVVIVNLPGTAGDVYGKRYNAGNSACNNNVQVSLTPYLQSGTSIGLPGLYYADITISRLDAATGFDGIMNAISLRQTSGVGYAYDSTTDYIIAPIGHVTGGASIRGTAVTLDARTGPTNYGLKVRFGTNCNITAAGLYELVFYDLDGVDGDGAQKNGPIRLKLKRESPTGVVQWLTSGTNTWSSSEPSFASAKIPGVTPNADWLWDFYAHPNYSYEVQILNIYQNNTIQLSTPFDNIYGVRDCDRPDAKVYALGRWDKSSVEVGESATFSSKVANTSSRTGYVNDGRREIWEDDGDSILETPNDTNSNGTPAGSNGDRLITNTRFINSNTAIGTPNGFVFASNAWTEQTGRPQVCGYVYNVVASPLGTGGVDTTVTDSADGSCVKIAKYPAMTVRNGDLRTGGTFPEGQSVCTLRNYISAEGLAPYGVRSHYYKSNKLIDNATANPYANQAFKGGFSTHGVVSVGEIENFGSLGGFYKGGTGSGVASSYGLFGTQAWGADGYGYGAEGSFLGESDAVDLTGVGTPTHCLPDILSLYPPPAAPTTLSAVTTYARVTDTRYYSFAAGGGKALRLCANPTATTCDTAAVALAKNQKITIRITQPEDTDVLNEIIIHGRVNSPAAATVYNSVVELPQFTLIIDKPIKLLFRDDGSQFGASVIGTTYNIYTCGRYDGIGAYPNTAEVVTTLNGCPGEPFSTGGVMIAGGRVYPFRTDGFDTRAQDATFAELFNFYPTVLLSDYTRAQQQQGKLRVDYQTELPTRF